ncbi:hypothetical protein Tco_1016678 [Tanacetum coccineum]|uniref:Uncharacterized protein n=1 Tax=Tanacetum coccineum TaxID=301880 RepID=A0ABQ5FQL9_9ASTR
MCCIDLPVHCPECLRSAAWGNIIDIPLIPSGPVVFPKFDLHIYTSELTSSELKTVVTEYNIPLDLHLRLPPPGMTMNRLPSRYIGLYIKQLEQGGLRIPFSSFFLAVIRHFGGHWFSFENKTGRGTKKCFKEVTSRLKWWKRKIFLLDRCAIPDAMPWKHGDTDLHDDFSASYNKNDAARLSEFLVHLRPPPRHLLYVCGLTTDCRHPESQYNIRDQDNNEAKRDGAGNAEGPRKKRRVQKHNESTQSSSKEAFSATLLHQATPEVARRLVTVVEVSKDTPHPEKEVVDLSGNTCVTTPLGWIPSLHRTLNTMISFAPVFSSGNRSDVHLVELDHLRSSLQRVTQDNEGLTNKLNLLDSAHRMFISRERVGEKGERSREGRVEDYCLGSEFIPDVVKRLHTSVKYRQSLAAQVSLCFTARWLRGLSLGRSEDQVAQFLTGTKDLDIEGLKSWEEKHRELFTKQYPYIKKVTDSYLLPVADLMKVSPDVPTPPPANKTGAPNADGAVMCRGVGDSQLFSNLCYASKHVLFLSSFAEMLVKTEINTK